MSLDDDCFDAMKAVPRLKARVAALEKERDALAAELQQSVEKANAFDDLASQKAKLCESNALLRQEREELAGEVERLRGALTLQANRHPITWTDGGHYRCGYCGRGGVQKVFQHPSHCPHAALRAVGAGGAEEK